VAIEQPEPEPEPIIEMPAEKPGTPIIEVAKVYTVIYSYLVRPDDYLLKIASNEYGDPDKWRDIYERNKERIGDDPNYILPFHNLELAKPEDQILITEYDFIIHVVAPGENLWSISKNKYGYELAWMVVFTDNEELLNANSGLLRPGMELRIRTKLW